MKLREYQQAGYEAVLGEFASGVRSTLVVMPTGTGKTVLFGHVANEYAARTGKRVLVVAHREELIFQARDSLGFIMGATPDVEMADQRAARTGLFADCPAVITSVQTQNASRSCSLCGGDGELKRDELDDQAGTEPCPDCMDGVVRRMQRFDPREFGLIIVDEAHHSPATTYRRMLSYYRDGNPDLRVLGVTATPDRQDEVALGKIFDSVAFEYPVLSAIKDGWLVPIRQEYVRCRDLDFSSIRTTAGDLNGGDLEKAMREEKVMHQVVSPTIDIVGDRATLFFAASVAHAETIAEILNRHKPDSATLVTGTTPTEDRRRRLLAYKRGAFQFLVGCGVFLEGYDEPRIEVVAMARPTKSRALYAQAIGRGTRPVDPPVGLTAEARLAEIAASRKPNLLVLDFVGNSGRHKLVSTADILGGHYPDDVVDLAVRKAQAAGGAQDMQKVLDEAAQEMELERKRKRALELQAQKEAAERRRDGRRGVKASARFSRKVVDPFDLFDITEEREPGYLVGKEPSPRQLMMLEGAGLNAEGITRHKAKALVDELFRRRDEQLCTPKQAKVLARYGYDPANMKIWVARQILDKLAANRWQPIR